MGGMEFNKIFAAILVAGIVACLGGFVARELVHAEHPHEFAYNIEEAEAPAAGGAAVAMPEPILELIAAADVSKGEKVAKACAACHNFAPGGPNGVGPNLYGVLGGPKDHKSDFAYSGALVKNGSATWTYEDLNKFLWKPKAYAPGTKMTFVGLKKAEDRAAVIAWLRTQSASPKGLPSAGEIAAEKADLTPPAAATPADAAAPAAEAGKDAKAAPVAADAKAAAPVAPAKH